MSTAAVVCAACGARMKTNRRSCLRCGEALVTIEAAAATADASQPLSQRTTTVVGVVATVVVLGLAGVLWRTSRDDLPRNAAAEAIQAAVRPTTGAARTSTVGDTHGAVPSYEPASFIDETRRGGAAFVSGDFEAARATYERAVAKRPNDPDALNSLGQALVRLGRVDEAIAQFEHAVQVAPETWAPHFNLAAAEGQRGNWDRAVAEYREAARRFADDYVTQFNLALALHKKGDETAAIAEYENAIRLAPGEPSFHVALAVSLEKVGRVDDAVREYRVALEMDPDFADAASVKAHVEALTQNTQTAR
jgi:Flp pilus assembly protein TadD